MFKKLLNAIVHLYDTKYKQLMIIPILVLTFSLIVIGSHYFQTGEFIEKGVSLKGGTTLSIAKEVDFAELNNFLAQKFPNSDLSVRSLSKGTSSAEVVVESADIPADKLLSAVEEHIGTLQKTEYTVDTTGPSLGASFFKQAIIAVIVAFFLMSIVIYLYFRVFLPSFYAVFCVFADMMFALAMVDLFNIKLTTAGVAAFLMLIGYSVDTDILLTTRVLKRTEGTVGERMASAVPTGLTMTAAALVAVLVAYFATNSEILRQIMFILGWGLVADIFYTWAFNASLLRWYVENKINKVKQNAN